MYLELKKLSENDGRNFCLSCGTSRNLGSRRYCSVKCRQNLRQKLNMKSGLFQALNTRFATFYFSERMIVLDIVPYGIKKIFRYAVARTDGHAPAYDFNKLTNNLGEEWWKISQKTNKKYLACQHVLRMAIQFPFDDYRQRPRLIRIPTVKTESLHYLGIDKADLYSRDLRTLIKNAYRTQVKIHHPDAGGQSANFRKIHDAYKDLLRWADNPIFVRRRGFPDKWYYSGETKKWVQPTSVRR
ncbi:MAG TPA: J domain-containing protein [Smithella sp.]|nr:J domain-containing protein [Smithella sp.]